MWITFHGTSFVADRTSGFLISKVRMDIWNESKWTAKKLHVFSFTLLTGSRTVCLRRQRRSLTNKHLSELELSWRLLLHSFRFKDRAWINPAEDRLNCGL